MSDHIEGKPVSRSTYVAGCRCVDCCAKATAYSRELKERLLDRDVPAEIHGRRSTYTNWGCRCPGCAAAHAEYMLPRNRARRLAGAR